MDMQSSKKFLLDKLKGRPEWDGLFVWIYIGVATAILWMPHNDSMLQLLLGNPGIVVFAGDLHTHG